MQETVIMNTTRLLTIALLLATVYAYGCKPSALSSDTNSEISGSLTLSANKNTTISVTASKDLNTLEGLEISPIGDKKIKFAASAFAPRRYTALAHKDEELKFRIQIKKTANYVCATSPSGTKLQGSIALSCIDRTSQLADLKKACLELEKENASFASFPNNDDYCICSKKTETKISYKEFLGFPEMFKTACKSGKSSPQAVCSIIAEKSCPEGKECFAGELACQCGNLNLSYDDPRFKDNMPLFRDTCLQALGISETTTNQNAEKPQATLSETCKNLNNSYECIDEKACGPTESQCDCGEKKLVFAAYKSQPAAFATECKEGFASAHLKALAHSCQKMVLAGTATAGDETSCTCNPGTFNFSSYLGFAGGIEQLEYDCFGD